MYNVNGVAGVPPVKSLPPPPTSPSVKPTKANHITLPPPSKTKQKYITLPRKKSKSISIQTYQLNKMKKSIDGAVGHLVCPITQILPTVPVMAEDGQIYEKESIVKWLKTKRISPITKKPMGCKLQFNRQVANLIHSLVTSGQVSGDVSSAWNEKLRIEKKEKEEAEKIKELVEKLKQSAEAGDANAMYKLGEYYMKDGKTDKDAFEWYLKAHTAGSDDGTLGLRQWVDKYVTMKADLAKEMKTNLQSIALLCDYHFREINKEFGSKYHHDPDPNQNIDELISHLLKEKSEAGSRTSQYIPTSPSYSPTSPQYSPTSPQNNPLFSLI